MMMTVSRNIRLVVLALLASQNYAYIPTSLQIHNVGRPLPTFQSTSPIKGPCHNNHRKLVTHSKARVSSTSLGFNLASLSDVAKLSAPAGSLFVLAFIILVHETGHFLAARSLGIQVEEFSVGVGPKLFGFQKKGEMGNEDEGINNSKMIDFSIRAIPLGGYVKFPENYNSTLVLELEMEADKIRQELKISKRNPVVVKPESNLLVNVRRRLMEIFSFEPQTIDPRKKFIVRDDGTVELPPVEYNTNPNLLQNRPWSDRAIVLVAGIVFNLALSFSLYFGEVTLGEGIPQPIIESGAVVKSILPDGASKGLLQAGDVILSLNGQPVSKSSSSAYGAQRSIAAFIDQIRASKGDSPLHLSVYRATIAESIDVDIVPQPMKSNGQMSIGTSLSPNFVGLEFVKAKSPIDAVIKSFTAVSDLTQQTVRTFSNLVSSLVISHTLPAGQSMSGPIGVLKMGSDVISSNRLSAVISFAAALSVNLAVVNALPLPALDGGQLVFVLAEALTGKKIDQRRQEGITGAALFVLLLVSVGTAIQDLTSLIR